MSLFAHLQIEDEVQENDRTRLKASKSFATVDNDPITDVTIKPGDDGSVISVFNADTDRWYLDWQFPFEMDINSENNKLDFSEDGGTTELTATLTSGTYTLQDLIDEIDIQINATGSYGYTFTLLKNNKLSITSTGNFTILTDGSNKDLSIWKILGFKENQTNKVDVLGLPIEYLEKAITVSVTDATITSSQVRFIKVYSVDGDYLFSNDSDLTRHEAKILEWVEDGRNTFLNEHRRAQHLILAYLDRNGYVDIYRKKFTKFSILDTEEVHEWSVHLTLKLIFDSIYNSLDDVFYKKARQYEALEKYYRDRVILRLDVDGNGEVDSKEGIGIAFATVVRR